MRHCSVITVRRPRATGLAAEVTSCRQLLHLTAHECSLSIAQEVLITIVQTILVYPPSIVDSKPAHYLCSAENAMCFVRSWSARARHAWIVQRGCYLSTGDDSLPRSMTIPTRAMTCKHEKHADAEYKVCLCQADWCNSAPSVVSSITQYFMKGAIYMFGIIVII
ncbi:hypothetical protein B5X24_HaOG209836 [Helicoverpa armigera]|nr:hypothetical protein B5X24_HaOG209836 [Helicoverpa armigera]